MRAKIKLIRVFKYSMLGLGIHRVLPAKLSFLGYLSKLSRWIAEHKEGMAFSSFPKAKFNYDNRLSLFEFIIESELKHEPIDYLEFGVAKGGSFRWWLKNYPNSTSRFFGFDTFTGLPEDWGPFKKGDMSNGNELPVIEDERGAFFQGVFQDTLFTFLKNFERKGKLVLHLDADLYSSTLFVLTAMHPYLKPGDIILFDEFNVPLHEFKALMDYQEAYYPKYTVLAETNNFYQMALRVEAQS